jgi:glutamyl-tRNA reductase
MPILALGVSYRRAPVELLERLAFSAEDLPKAYRRLLEMEAVQEAVIVSTCNRVEVFGLVTTYHAGFLDLKRFMSESRDVAAEEFAEPLYAHYEEEAADHLFRVAAGLDSMVLGEPQILTQVRQAFLQAEQEGATGPILSALLRGAIRAGRRVRAETEIGAAPDAFVRAGADLAAQALGDLSGRTVVMVGAGGMVSVAIKHLRQRGVGRIRIVNRSVDRAQRLAARVGGEPAEGLDSLAGELARADLVVSCTGAPGVVIPASLIRRARDSASTPRPLFLLDLAVPRDVDPSAADLPGVRVADIDDLRDLVQRPDGNGKTEVHRAEGIVTGEVQRFQAWRRAARLAPLIQAMRQKGESISASELKRLAPRLADLTDQERQAVMALAEGIVAKMLHDPIVRLRELSGPGGGDAHARALAELFGIEFRPDAQ